MINGPSAHHLEILGFADKLYARIGERRGEADTLHGRLRDAVDRRWHVHVEHVQHGGDNVDGMRELSPNLAAGLDLRGPVHDQGLGRPAARGIALPPQERRVAGPCPTGRVDGEGVWAAPLASGLGDRLERGLHVIEEHDLVGQSMRASLNAGSVVGGDDDQSVLELA